MNRADAMNRAERAARGTVAARRALPGDARLYMISMLSAMGPFWPMRVIMRTR